MYLLSDPSSIPTRLMSDVATTVVNRAYEDPGYYSTAALICHMAIEVPYFIDNTSTSFPKYLE